MKSGGSVKIDTFRKMIKASMIEAVKDIDGYILDEDISQETARVYHNPTTNKTIVIHRGTASLSDWALNLSYGLGVEQYLPRWQISKEVQESAVKKYGKVDTIGSSLGATLASDLAENAVTYNKPIYPKSKQKDKEFNIRSEYDPVSAINIISGYKPKNEIIIPSKIPRGFDDLLEEHKSDKLKKLDPDLVIGNGFKPGLNNSLTNLEIDNILSCCKSYNGCYCKDQLPPLKKGWYIINLENHTGEGSHWTAMHYQPNIYFDSFGCFPPDDLEDKLEPYIRNKKQIQHIDATSCGYYATECVKCCDDANPTKQFNNFCDLFSQNSLLNEPILAKLIKYR